MNIKGKYFRFIALVLLFGLVITGCLSTSDSPSENSSAKGGKASAQAAGGGKAASAQKTAGKASSGKSDLQISATSQKIWTKSTGFIKKNWLSLLIILIICISCTISSIKAKQKIKKTLKKRIVIASIILVSLGLIYGVLHFGILRNDGNFKQFKWNQITKPTAKVKNEAKVNNVAKMTYAYVNTAQLNLRNGKSLSHKVIKVLPRNTRLEVISGSGTWWKVKHEKTEGYVNSKYLRNK